MIDEIDLHLHPQWECEILSKLQKTFPNCQFIVSTHSPLVLTRVEPEDIFMLSYNDKSEIIAEHPILAKGLAVKDILSGLMNDVGNRDLETSRLLKKIDDAIVDEDITSAKENIVTLKSYLNGKIIPEMQGLEATIAMLEAEANEK